MGNVNYEKQQSVDIVYDYIMDCVSSGVWALGDKISSESELCSHLNVSRVTVRSAIQRLVSLGVLRSVQGKGTFVCDVSPAENLDRFFSRMLLMKANYVDMFEFRRILEAESASLAALRASSTSIEAMKVAIKKMEQAETTEEIAKYDMEFHSLLIEATNNPIIIRAFGMIHDIYLEHMRNCAKELGTFGVNCHYELLNAIVAREPETAKNLMSQHIEEAIKHVHY